MCNQPAFFRAVYTGRLTEEDAFVLVHARVREEQRGVVVGHDRRTRPVRVRVALEVLDEGAPDLGLGPALGRVGDALSEAHRFGLGLKLGRHGRQRCAWREGRADQHPFAFHQVATIAMGNGGTGKLWDREWRRTFG